MAELKYTPAPIVGEFIQDFIPGELFYSFIVGPFGCLAPDTLVLTEHGPIPISRIDRPMRVLSWSEKTCRFQLSWCGGSFPKGRDYLYRVTTPEGEFDAAGQHRLLCADGEYRRVEDLHSRDVLASYSHILHPTIGELFRSTSPEDVQRCSQRHVDYLGRCVESDRQYGQLALQAINTGQETVQPLTYVQVLERCFGVFACSLKGDLAAQSPGHIHLELRDDHSRTDDSGNLVERHRKDGAYHIVPSSVSHIVGIARQGLQFLSRSASRLLGMKFFELRGSYSLSPSERTIISIKHQEVKQDFWDMQVEETHNYITADGTIHHNSAKTTGGLFKIPYMASLQAPSPIDGIRRSRCVVVRNTAPQLADTTLKSWNIWFKDGVAGVWKATQKTFVLRFDDVECEVMFRALDTLDDVSKVLSLEVTFAVLDEFVQIKTEIREGLSGRCGRYPPTVEGGATNFGMWGMSNPGEEDTDWHKFLIEDKPDNVNYFHQPSGLSPDAENRENLPPGYYENLAKGKSPSWIKQFVEAEWGFSIAGKPVIPTFSRDIHVAKMNLTPDKYLPLIIGFDPGMHSALIFGQYDGYGRLHVIDELVLEGYGAVRMCTDRLIPLIRQKYAGFEIIIAPDPASNSRTPTNETTVLQVLKDARFKKYWSVKVGSTNLIAPRLEAIEHFTTRLTEKGAALVIDPRCRTIIKALASGWRYESNRRNGEDKDTPEKNIYSHPGDALGYLAQYCTENVARKNRGAQNQRNIPQFKNNYTALR